MIEALARMEARGISIDRAILSRLSGEFAQDMARLEAEIFSLAGESFNLGSPKQLGDILFGKMGLPGAKKTATGAWSTAAGVLEDLAEEGNRIRRAHSRLAAALKAQIDLYRRAALLRQSDDAARAHVLCARRDDDRHGSRRRSRICKIFRCAPRRAARSAAPLSRRRAISSSRRIIRRSNCGCSPISPTFRNCARPSPTGTTFTR